MSYVSDYSGPEIDESVSKTQNMDQGVSTTDSPEFAGLTVGGNPVNTAQYNDIGIAGKQGFGVGICPSGFLPPGMTLLPGTETVGHDNYGNYQFSEGSICCYVPIHWVKIGTGANDLLVNEFKALKYSAFASEADANAYGYFLPRCFIDGGEIIAGYFVDKYQASKNALGDGFVASSIKNGLPISTRADHNPIAGLTACGSNHYYQAINAAHARDGVDGAINPDSDWFCCSRFIYVNLATLSMAHGQAASSTINCAWFDPAGLTNFPKGCNNNALGDYNDPSVTYVSDGYSDCGKTGSGNPFAKTTHNGQNCGVADLNGNMYEISLGVTCVAESKAITAITQANPCQITVEGHGMVTGQHVVITSVEGTTEINGKLFTVTKIDVNNVTLDDVDSTAFGAYVSGGTVTYGDFYVASKETAMKDFTPGNSGPTDHWGAVGVAAMMTKFTPEFVTIHPSNGFGQRMGSGTNQVLSESIDGNGAILRSLGMPIVGGADTSGTNQFGKDRFYQYIRNELCVRSGLNWSSTSGAGVWGSSWGNSRTYSSRYVSFRAACRPVQGRDSALL